MIEENDFFDFMCGCVSVFVQRSGTNKWLGPFVCFVSFVRVSKKIVRPLLGNVGG